LWAKGLTAKDIHKEVFSAYGGKCLSCNVVHNWVKKFSQGHSRVADDAQPGYPVELGIKATGYYKNYFLWMEWVEELIQTDRRILIDSVVTALGCSRGLAYSIMCDCLKFCKVWMWWVPRELKDR
jgi:hypothetical protein